MTLRHDELRDADAFLVVAGPYLLVREAEHNLMLGLAERDPQAAWFAVCEADGEVVGAALRTPPWNVVLSACEHADAPALLARAAGDAPGVVGPKEEAAAFAREWEALTGGRAEVAVAERLHRCDRVVAPAAVGGRMRPYRDADRPLVRSWLDAFVAEAAPGAPEAGEALLARRLAEPEARFVLWEDGGEPVSLAGCTGATANGIRVGPVYTPPALRGRGYASALVAAFTAELLERRRFCVLYTDLANPTANALYARVGYEPLVDVDQWRFTPPSANPASVAATRSGSVRGS